MKNSLTKLELKKICSNKAVKIACCLIILYVIVALSGSINSEEIYISNTPFTGIDAIKEKKTQVQKVKGYLDDKKIKHVINYNHQLKNNKDNITTDGSLKNSAYAHWVPYLDIAYLIITSYSPLDNNDYKIINKLSAHSSKEFYTNRIKKINDHLNSNYPKLHKADAEAIIMESKKLSTPLYYDYVDGWTKLFDNLFFLNLVIIFILCFSVCTMFTSDIQNHMALVVFPTINGKTKLALSKIKASIIFTSITYLVSNLLFSVALLSFYGITGWNCPLQATPKYWLSIYNIKFYEAYIIAIIVGLSVCIFMVMLTLLVSNIVKKAFLTMSVTICLLVIPFLVNTTTLSKIPANLLELLPIKALNITYTLKQHYMYDIFGMQILRAYITPIILLISTMILIPFIIKLYNKQKA